MELEIKSLAYGGDGIGRHEGRVIFIPLAAPEDVVEVEITKQERRHARAEIIEIKKPGPGREKAPCPYYGECGGCAYQHLDYPTELEWKRRQVVELLQRVGRFAQADAEALVRPTLPSPEPYGYRNRITVHTDESGRIGFWHRCEPGRLVDIKYCMLALPEVNEELAHLRSRRPQAGHYSLRTSGIATSGFHQANQLLLEDFKRQVVTALEPNMEKGVLLEGYAGGGFFTADLAKNFARIEMIESDPRLVKDARRVLPENVVIHQGRVEDYLPARLMKLRSESAAVSVLVDPPREGLAKPVVEALVEYPADQFVYVSCDPATFARDAALLAKSYTLEWVQPVDLFARTAAIECVSRWRKD